MDLRRGLVFRWRQPFTALLGAFIILSLVVTPAMANHAWGTFHWSRGETTPKVLFKVGDNLTTTVWKGHLIEAVTDWNGSTVIGLDQVTGSTSPKQCKPVAGTIQVCNATYGTTGWLGIAQVWLSGGHISQGTAKQNDTYFNKAQYNSSAWRQMVLCQEVAHAFGLGHVNENHGDYNTGSCMDYTNAPAGGIVNGVDYGPSNDGPNAHDFELLASIYQHSHTATTTTKSTAQSATEDEVTSNDPKAWGRVTERDEKGRPTHYERDLGPNEKVVTFVIPADEPGDVTDDGSTGRGGHSHGGSGDDGKRDSTTADDPGGHDHEGSHANTGDKKQADGKRDGKLADGKRDGAKNGGGEQSKKQQQQNRHGKRGR